VYAIADIADDETILYVPRRLLLTMDVARDGRYGRMMRAAGVELNDEAHLGLFLTEVRRDGGFWAPYVANLPITFDDLPICWDAAEWRELDGSCTQRMARGLFDNLRADFRRVRAVLPAAERMGLREFAWGWMAASTRCFNLSVDGRPMPTMVPMADMMNCADEEHAGWSGDHSAALEYKAKPGRRLCAEAQVTASYGPAPNTMRLAQYGFTLSGNPLDEVRVHVALPQGHFAAGGPELHDGIAAGHAYDVRADARHDGLRRLLSFLRLTSLPSEDVARRHPALRCGDPRRLPPLDPCNERIALERLRAACAQRLDLFEHTIERDDELLAKGTLHDRHRAAIVARRGEKKVLLDLVAFASAAIPLLALPTEAREEALARGEAAAGPMAGWFGQCLAAFGVRTAQAV